MSGKPKKFLIVGSGGREGAFAKRLAEDTQVHAIISHENPLIVDCVIKSGGAYEVGDSDDPHTVLDFAKKHGIDYAFVNADQPLANGVVDTLLENDIKAIGGTKLATRIEWDKIYSIEMLNKICPEFVPFYKVVSEIKDLEGAVSEFISRGLEAVVKPVGLTGGKGVKVMPDHLPVWKDCIDYASHLLHKDGKVLLVERLHGIEFTIMGITDGNTIVLSPASYDYPFRHEDDRGAGTGGMGCFTDSSEKLPFMSNKDLEDCRKIMQMTIDELRKNNLCFNGVLNGGFFKTAKGIRFMEFNGRFGDPEGLNILSVLEGSFSELLIHMWDKTLTKDAVSFSGKASVIKYLVAAEYPEPSKFATSFSIDHEALKALKIDVFPASCIRTADTKYETLKRSRACAFGAVSDDIAEASSRINDAIKLHVKGDLEFREDVGSKHSLEKIDKINSELSAR